LALRLARFPLAHFKLNSDPGGNTIRAIPIPAVHLRGLSKTYLVLEQKAPSGPAGHLPQIRNPTPALPKSENPIRHISPDSYSGFGEGVTK
jgi:hypothetical protein